MHGTPIYVWENGRSKLKPDPRPASASLLVYWIYETGDIEYMSDNNS